MSLASVTAQQNNALAIASTAGSVGTSGSSGNTALASLSSNFNDFLKMLMTQLQNQDPTNPMDTNQFTSELVQFSGVEQQINTNTSLTQLIQLTQAGEVMQASAMSGKQVTVTSDHVPLQNGKGTIQFTTRTAQPVDILIYDSTGNKLSDNMMMSTAGINTWTWNGTNSRGAAVPDGSYKVAVVAAGVDGTTSAVSTNVIGTATGVQSQSSGSLALELGALSVPFSQVVSVGN
ncbi:MAG TPA: flagellar hook capping FlgD N-terminal domain-containing protein [Acetobacteraceae bacterium]|jgi:flagellar basal-body rod modification protein FlgD|nr:flagellar hook capping FlgD N-terminal domain-containing protein [Acetobacteraceae bacterium]